MADASPVNSVERSRSRSRSTSRERRKGYSRSRSRSPRHSSPAKDPQTAEHDNWEDALEALISEGKLKRSDLQESTLQSLKDLPAEQSNYVLSRLKLSRLERIHNINGFIATIIKRTQREGLDDVEGDMGLLPRAVERRMEGLLAEGAVARHEVDRRICTALSELAPAQAMEAVDRFARTDLSTVRSKTGFMLSIISRVAREAREAIEREVRDSMAYAPPPHAAPYGAPPPAYHGSYDHRAYGGYAPPADNRGYGYGR